MVMYEKNGTSWQQLITFSSCVCSSLTDPSWLTTMLSFIPTKLYVCLSNFVHSDCSLWPSGRQRWSSPFSVSPLQYLLAKHKPWHPFSLLFQWHNEHSLICPRKGSGKKNISLTLKKNPHTSHFFTLYNKQYSKLTK